MYVKTHVMMLHSEFCAVCSSLSDVPAKRILLINMHERTEPLQWKPGPIFAFRSVIRSVKLAKIGRGDEASYCVVV